MTIYSTGTDELIKACRAEDWDGIRRVLGGSGTVDVNATFGDKQETALLVVSSHEGMLVWHRGLLGHYNIALAFIVEISSRFYI